MNEFVKQYSESMKVVMQQNSSRLGLCCAKIRFYHSFSAGQVPKSQNDEL